MSVALRPEEFGYVIAIIDYFNSRRPMKFNLSLLADISSGNIYKAVFGGIH